MAEIWTLDGATTLESSDGEDKHYWWRKADKVVRPKIERGVDHGRTAHVLIATPEGMGGPRLVWQKGHRSWHDLLTGFAYNAAVLSIERRHPHYETKDLADGGRFGRPMLLEAASAICDAFEMDPARWSEKVVERALSAYKSDCTWIVKQAAPSEVRAAGRILARRRGS